MWRECRGARVCRNSADLLQPRLQGGVSQPVVHGQPHQGAYVPESGLGRGAGGNKKHQNS